MKKYLCALKNEDSPVGDLVSDLLSDKSYPHVKYTITNIKSHIMSQTSDAFFLSTMRELFKRYRTRNSSASFAREK